jgi:hypothetical protein
MEKCPKCKVGWVTTKYSYTNPKGLNDECLIKRCLGCGYWWTEPTEDAKEKSITAETSS